MNATPADDSYEYCSNISLRTRKIFDFYQSDSVAWDCFLIFEFSNDYFLVSNLDKNTSLFPNKNKSFYSQSLIKYQLRVLHFQISFSNVGNGKKVC